MIKKQFIRIAAQNNPTFLKIFTCGLVNKNQIGMIAKKTENEN